ALNSGVCLILVFLVVIVHLVSDCTHLTRCPKLLVRIIYQKFQYMVETMGIRWLANSIQISTLIFAQSL
ncbi:hypothetical protein KW517_01545, partial [Vibrio fluvialis]|nr:hypothetical protein [Vibrio fluvialis]